VTRRQLILVLAVAILIGTYFVLDLGRFLSVPAIKEHRAALSTLQAERPLFVLGVFFVVYVAATALSVPGAAVLTLAAGALFGVTRGTVVASFASSLGATLAFLSSRYVLRGAVQRRFGARLAEIDAGVARDGPFYLFSLRLVPLVPFVVVNLLMGLTAMPTRTFYVVSQVGMLAGTVAYVNAGTQLSRVESLHGILSPALWASFVVLGLFPLGARKLLAAARRRRRLSGPEAS
jgi:uncharacterized membrane protein YdjX (TVP38/TMEM64 family)